METPAHAPTGSSWGEGGESRVGSGWGVLWAPRQGYLAELIAPQCPQGAEHGALPTRWAAACWHQGPQEVGWGQCPPTAAARPPLPPLTPPPRGTLWVLHAVFR